MNTQTGRPNPQGGPAETGTVPASTAVAANPALAKPSGVEQEPSRYSFEGLLLFRS